MPTGLHGPLEDHSYDWYFTLAFKDRTRLVDPVLLKGAIEPSNLELLLNPSQPHYLIVKPGTNFTDKDFMMKVTGDQRLPPDLVFFFSLKRLNVHIFDTRLFKKRPATL